MEAYLFRVATFRLVNDENLYFNPYQDLTYSTLDGALNDSRFQNLRSLYVWTQSVFIWLWCTQTKNKSLMKLGWITKYSYFFDPGHICKNSHQKNREFPQFGRLHLVGDEFCLSSRSIEVVLSMQYNLRKQIPGRLVVLSWSPQKKHPENHRWNWVRRSYLHKDLPIRYVYSPQGNGTHFFDPQILGVVTWDLTCRNIPNMMSFELFFCGI